MEKIRCKKCGKNLLKEKDIQGNVVLVNPSYTSFDICNIYFSCKECDSILTERHEKELDFKTSTDELNYFINPLMWISRLRYYLHKYIDENMSDKALAQFRCLFVSTLPFVCKPGKESWTDEKLEDFFDKLSKEPSKEDLKQGVENVIRDIESVLRDPTKEEKEFADSF